VTLAAIRLMSCRLWMAVVLIVGPARGFAAVNSAWLMRAWQTEEGLPNTYVSSVVQGPDGFL